MADDGFGISKTIPKSEGREALDALYDGSIDEYEFHMASNLKKVAEGDWVYTIFADELHGRCRIKRLEPGHENPCSGKPRTLVIVACPGIRLAEPVPRPSHMGTRYFDGADWPSD